MVFGNINFLSDDLLAYNSAKISERVAWKTILLWEVPTFLTPLLSLKLMNQITKTVQIKS